MIESSHEAHGCAVGYDPIAGTWRPPSPSRGSRRPAARSKFAARASFVGPDDVERCVESGVEVKTGYVALADRRLAALVEQPPPVAYRDVEGGLARTHTFDYLATLLDGCRVAIYVTAGELARRRNAARLVEELARQVPASVADLFVLVTDANLSRDRVADAMLVVSARIHPRPDHDAVMRGVVDGLDGQATVATLMGRAGLGGAGFRSVARLVGDGTLTLAGPGRIRLDALVARSATRSGEGRS